MCLCNGVPCWLAVSSGIRDAKNACVENRTTLGRSVHSGRSDMVKRIVNKAGF